MPVECANGDFSDPGAVSGSSTRLRARIAYLGDFFVLRSSVKMRSKEESTNLTDFIYEFMHETAILAAFSLLFEMKGG